MDACFVLRLAGWGWGQSRRAALARMSRLKGQCRTVHVFQLSGVYVPPSFWRKPRGYMASPVLFATMSTSCCAVR